MHTNGNIAARASGLLIGATLTAAAGTLLPAAAQAQAGSELAHEPRATLVAAWDGTVAWSTFDAQVNAYRLVVSRDGGEPRRVAVAPNPTPFDIDTGTDRSGSTYAVYSRDGDLYRLSLTSYRETKLVKLSDPRRVERDPTIFRGKIAFIRRVGNADELRIANKTSGSRRLVRSGSLRAPELSQDRVAYIQSVRGRYGFGEQRVRVRTLRTGRDRMVYRAASGGANVANITDPSVTEDLRFFTWARTNAGSGTGNRLIRWSVRSGRFSYARGTRRAHSTAWASNTLGMAIFEAPAGGEVPCDEPGGGGCRVALTGPVTWQPRP